MTSFRLGKTSEAFASDEALWRTLPYSGRDCGAAYWADETLL
jgi:hypothetical protein